VVFSLLHWLTRCCGSLGNFYVKAMQQIEAKGAEYVANERARLHRIMESGSVAVDKAADFALRRNVLAAFQ
jgi:hypothetical protein